MAKWWRNVTVVIVAVAMALGGAAAAQASQTSLDGTVTDALTGAPVESAAISAYFPNFENWRSTTTDSTGHFELPDAPPAGIYNLQIYANGYLEKRIDGVDVPGTIDVSLMPIQYGSITGHVTDRNGVPLEYIGVELFRDGNQAGWATTGGDGSYEFNNVQTGTYTIAYHYPSGAVVWYDNADPYNPTPFEVTPGAVTVLDVVRPPVGNVTLTVKDAQSGALLEGICWYPQDGPISWYGGCTGADGKLSLRDLPVGTYSAGSYDVNNVYLNGHVDGLVVTEGKTAAKTVRLRKGAQIHVSLVNAATGAPVSGACIDLVTASARGRAAPNGCGYGSTIDVIDMFPADFNMFVVPIDTSLGAQWVGATGGTGYQEAAVDYSVTYGQRLDITVRLDAGGNITGVVTDAATGDPVEGVCPTATGPAPTGGGSDCTYTSGVYYLNSLGPYEWKLAFPSYPGAYAWQWSGGAPTRATATPVKVVAGQTVTANAALVPAGKITGTVTVPADADPCVTCVVVYAIDAATGYVAGVYPNVQPNGTFTITGLNTQQVIIEFYYRDVRYRYDARVKTKAGTTVSGIKLAVPAH